MKKSPTSRFVLAECLMLLVFSITASAETLYLRANQAGYRPADAKSAVAFSSAALSESFVVWDDATQREAFHGVPAVLVGAHWGQFTNYVELDFSKLAAPGRYRLVMGEVKSLPFTLGDQVYAELPDVLLEFMRQQRCGYNPFLDAKCHQYDGRTAYGPLTNGTFLDATGGWHDAADLLKYLLTSGNATAQMLVAYKLSPHGFADRANALGQPGTNGVPDVLDEARWGLEWMLKLHPAPDQLYHLHT
jgi:endoglucanase